MLHLFLLLNTSMIILDQNVTPINEQEKLPDVRLRIIYDILLESATKHPHSPYLQDLVCAILQHVETHHQIEEKKRKEKEAEKLKEKVKNKEKVKETAKERRERKKKKKSIEVKEEVKETTPIPMEIKGLIIDTIIATFGFGDDVRTEFSKEDESEHYETLVKLCYDNKEFDAKKIELSRSKKFSEYNFEDYIINYTISSIHISFVKYACDIIKFMIQKDLWSLAHAQNFIKITKSDNRLVKAIIEHGIGATTKITDCFLGTLLTRDFQKDHLIEKLRDLKKEGVKTIVIAYSMGEVLSAIQHYINWKRMGGFYGLTMQVIAESSHIASIMNLLHNYDALEAPELYILNRQLTKYEIMDMHDYKRITESIIDLWVAKMEENEKQLDIITKNMSQSQETPMSIDL